jgi:oligopeptide transport system substrate-binding protein
MRRLTAFAAALLLAGTALAETTLRRANGNEPSTLDPQKYELIAESNILREVFEGLTTQDADNNIIPGQAESWTMSPDGLVWTFKLREGIVWSDGMPVTAEDFVAGARRLVDPKTASQIPDIAFAFKNAREIVAGKVPPEELGYRALDERTVEITLEKPSPLVPLLVAAPGLSPLPRHLYEKEGDGWTRAGVIVSNGAYILAEWNPQDNVKIVKNPLHYDAASVRVDAVRYYPTDDAEAALKRFRAGEVDFVPAIPASSVEQARDEMADAYVTTPLNQIRYFEVNHRIDRLKDRRVRRALAMAIDREAITANLLKGTGAPAYGFVPRSIEGYTGAVFDFKDSPLADRIESARLLLEAAGYSQTNPLPIKLRCLADTWARPLCINVNDTWTSIGVAVQLEIQEAKTHYQAVDVGDFDISISGWCCDSDPETFLWLFQKGGGINESGYANDVFDAARAKAEATLEMTERFANFAEAERILLDDVGTIPVFWTIQSALIAPRVKGFKITPRGTTRARYAWIEE